MSKRIVGITANAGVCMNTAERSLALSIAIAAIDDYPKAGAVPRFAAEKGLSIRDAAVQMELWSDESAEALFDVSIFADPARYQAVVQKFRRLVEISSPHKRN